jgi:hypothetical protein
MKKLNTIWTFILLMVLFSCSEQPIGQYPVDNTAPQSIANPAVQNTKGGAIITYTLPSEADLMFVKAVFTLPNGKQKIVETSAFTNSLIINGFAKSAKATVQLISVDKSKNESKPVSVIIEPLDSPIFDVFASLKVIAGFGGVKLSWSNPDKKDMVIGALSKNAEGKFVSLDNFYTTAANGLGVVRGLSPVPTAFAFFVRDIYDNCSDTLFTTMTPWEEQKLDKKLFKAMPLASFFTLSTYGSTNMAVLWDDVSTNINTTATMYYVNTVTTEKIFITFDLGVSAKLSRFKFWGRTAWYFNLHHPKEIEIWGTNSSTVANGDKDSYAGWQLLTSAISTKPSGPEVLADNLLTSEDKALAAAGEEFEFPLEAPVARYLRFKCVRTWTDSKSLFLGELTFWGNVAK